MGSPSRSFDADLLLPVAPGVEASSCSLVLVGEYVNPRLVRRHQDDDGDNEKDDDAVRNDRDCIPAHFTGRKAALLEGAASFTSGAMPAESGTRENSAQGFGDDRDNDHDDVKVIADDDVVNNNDDGNDDDDEPYAQNEAIICGFDKKAEGMETNEWIAQIATSV